jgi:hypothetical protein
LPILGNQNNNERETKMALKKGMAAVRESLERSQKSTGSKTYTETNWFYWTAGETKALRFLTDANDIFVVPVHENVLSHDGKKKTFVCRSVFEAPCELCENKVYRRDVGYGIAVLREEVYEEVDGQKKLAGYRDSTSTYEATVDGKTVTKKRPYVGIVSQGMRNFWNQIAVINEKYGSLRDREIEIMRNGSGTDTTYMAFALPEKVIEGMDERYGKFLPDVEAFLNRIGSQEYYDAQLRGIVKEKPAPQQASSSSSTDDEYADDEYVSIEEETTADRLRRKMANQ